MSIQTFDIAAIAPYSGPHAIPGIRFRPVRAALGVTSWGMNVIEIDPGADGYPEHDHREDGQEEVYLVLDGSATLVLEDEELTLHRGQLVRLPPERRRGFRSDEGVVLLALGATPGKVFEAKM